MSVRKVCFGPYQSSGSSGFPRTFVFLVVLLTLLLGRSVRAGVVNRSSSIVICSGESGEVYRRFTAEAAAAVKLVVIVDRAACDLIDSGVGRPNVEYIGYFVTADDGV